MKNLLALFLFALIGCSAASAQTAMPPTPWAFDMSPAEVSAVAEGLPYKKFSNGDLETYSAKFQGRPENFQFFFKDDKLRRIGIYLYEGDNLAAAGARWLEVQAWLARTFGAVRANGNAASNSGDAQAFMKEAMRVAESNGKTQLMPDQQPAATRIFASFIGHMIGERHSYLVILYFDKPTEAKTGT